MKTLQLAFLVSISVIYLSTYSLFILCVCVCVYYLPYIAYLRVWSKVYLVI